MKRMLFLSAIIIAICSCNEKPKTVYTPPQVNNKPWYPQTRAQADSSGQMNWVDAKGLFQGWWVITGAMQKDQSYRSDALVEEGLYIDSKKEGEWTYYSPTGNRVWKVKYKGGVEMK